MLLQQLLYTKSMQQNPSNLFKFVSSYNYLSKAAHSKNFMTNWSIIPISPIRIEAKALVPVNLTLPAML